MKTGCWRSRHGWNETRQFALSPCPCITAVTSRHQQQITFFHKCERVPFKILKKKDRAASRCEYMPTSVEPATTIFSGNRCFARYETEKAVLKLLVMLDGSRSRDSITTNWKKNKQIRVHATWDIWQEPESGGYVFHKLKPRVLQFDLFVHANSLELTKNGRPCNYSMNASCFCINREKMQSRTFALPNFWDSRFHTLYDYRIVYGLCMHRNNLHISERCRGTTPSCVGWTLPARRLRHSHTCTYRHTHTYEEESLANFDKLFNRYELSPHTAKY